MIHPFYSIHFVILIITILMDETKSSLSWSQKSPRSISVEHYNVNFYFIPISLWQSIWKRQRYLSYRFSSQLNLFDQFPWRFITLEIFYFFLLLFQNKLCLILTTGSGRVLEANRIIWGKSKLIFFSFWEDICRRFLLLLKSL